MLIAGISLAVIVLTGATVRLTEAGLGCENWPACSDERFVPEWEFHPWIEFGNRLVSGLVALAVAAAALTAYRRYPRRGDLVLLAWGLVVGVAAQIVLGGITVRVDLHPAFVGVHFLLSMVLLWNAIALWVRAGSGGPPTAALVDDGRLGKIALPLSLTAHSRLLVVLASVVLVTGTLVTGTGPNSGDSRAERLDFDLTAIARVHTAAVWCFLVVLVVLVLRLWRRAPGGGPAPTEAHARIGQALLVTSVAQGAVGYVQFALGVPPALVALHVAGAVIVWCLSVALHLTLFERPALDLTGRIDIHPADTDEMNRPRVLDTMGT